MRLCFKGENMNNKLATPLVILLAGLILLTIISPANAGVLGTPTWIMPKWHNVTDAYLGPVGDAYITGDTWMLNIWIRNDQYNSSDINRVTVDVRVVNIAVWFDWNKFYNTTEDVTVKFGDNYLFTITGVTENTTIASNLFTHTYKVYIDFTFTTQSGGTTMTAYGTWIWTPFTTFAVLTEDQYDANDLATKYSNMEDDVDSYVDNYAESLGLYLQAQEKAMMADKAYSQGDFSGAKTLYGDGIDLLTQAMATYTTKETAFENAELNMTQGRADAEEANATARLIEANGLANSMVINAVALVFFGLGFIIFGIAAVFYARKHTQPA
jgi:hypothetical protein